MTRSTHLLASWDPRGLAASGWALQVRADEVRALSTALERQGSDLAGRGRVVDVHLAQCEHLGSALRSAARSLDVVGRGLVVAAGSLERAQALLRQAEQVAAGEGLAVLPDGTVPVWDPTAGDRALSASASAQGHATEALACAAETDREAAALLRSVPGIDGPSWWSDLVGLLGAAALLAALSARGLPAPGTGPDRAAAWWASLTASEQQALVQQHPAEVGALEGVPADVRDRANRALLTSALAVPPPGRAWDEMLAWGQRMRLLLSVRDALARSPETRLLLLDPGLPGLAAVAVGDVGTAQHVAVLVPGLHATVTRRIGATVGDAVRLRERALSKHAGTVATVAWLGYHAPGLRAVTSDHRAQQGAALLRETLLGLDARAASAGRDLHLTVSGHSYGSVVAGYAVRERTGADALVALGSPGVSVGRVQELWVPPAQVFVAEAGTDPVADLSRFGADPSSGGFGGRQLQTDGRSDPQQERLRGIWGHSGYYGAQTESLDNLALVTVGLSDRASYD